MKEIVLFIAYKACSGRNFVWGNNPFQYKNATHLIAVVFFIHIIQVLSLSTDYLIFPIKPISGLYYFVLFGVCMLLLFLSEAVFSKRVLAKSISRYKESSINKYAKLIAYSYLSLNILILVGIIIVRNG